MQEETERVIRRFSPADGEHISHAFVDQYGMQDIGTGRSRNPYIDDAGASVGAVGAGGMLQLFFVFGHNRQICGFHAAVTQDALRKCR